MIATDQDALICDLAETYGIYNYRGLPVRLLATLAVGLREDSRIKMRLSEAKVTQSEMLLAAAVDRLSLLLWAKTEDGRNNVNRPRSILSILQGDGKQEGPVQAFETADDFEDAWLQITEVSRGR